MSAGSSAAASPWGFRSPVVSTLMCTELCDDKAHFSVPRGAWGEVGLDFLDAALAFRGLETRSLTVIVISTVGELEAPTSCCCERAFHQPAV